MKRNTAKLKTALLKAGIAEIEKHGLDQLSLRTIAKACGVTHGTPYRHFKSKESYLRAVLTEISAFYSQKILAGIATDLPARTKLALMGKNFVTFAKTYPHFFEALMIKYPFSYLDISGDTIAAEHDQPGFNDFKAVAVQFKQEEKLVKTEADIIVHLWSFISGLAILANSQDGSKLSNTAVQNLIEQMLAIYIKGAQT